MAFWPKKNNIIFITGLVFLWLFGPAYSYGAELELGLADAVKMAQEHSSIIKSARSESFSSTYDLKAAKASRYPTLSLSATSFYINKIQSIQIFTIEKPIGSKENYQTDLKLSVPLYTGGKISNQIKLQKNLSESKAADLEIQQLQNAYLSRKSYLTFMASIALVASAEASMKRVELINQDVLNRYKNGLADSIDILETSLAVEKTDQALKRQKTASNNAEIALAKLIGIPPEDRIIPTDKAPDPNIDEYEKQQPAKLAVLRPELESLKAKSRAAESAARLNSAAYFPNLSGYGGYSYGKPNKDQFNNTWNDYWIAGLSLTWDLNLGNKTGNSVNSARQLVHSTKMALNELEENLTLQAKISRENLLFVYQSYLSSQKQLDIATREYRLAKMKQKVGQLSINRLLELEADLTSAEQLFEVSKIDFYISETEFLYAIGSSKLYGGF